MFVLDTNVISELRQGKPLQSAAVRAWAVQQPASMLHLTAITLLELEIGVLSKARKDAAQGAVLRAWLNGVRMEFAGRILPFTEATALRCAPMHVPDPKAERDAMIAATALQHGFSVVTRNTADFSGMGVALLDPWVSP